MQKHWNDFYNSRPIEKLGWFEKNFEISFRLLEKVKLKEANVFLPGIGKSLFAKALAEKGSKLILNDVSPEALNHILPELVSYGVDSYAGDVSKPLPKAWSFDLWFDRAVLHFLTQEEQILGYFNNLKAATHIGSFAAFAEFTHGGAKKCATLPIRQYNLTDLQRYLGNQYQVVDSFPHTYLNPRGEERPYLYALFKRIS